MGSNPQTLSPGAAPEQQASLGRKYEGIAFTFCKAATLALLGQLIFGPRYILPMIALGAVLWYGVALYHGQKTTRCILRIPALIIAFWGLIGLLYIWLGLRSGEAFSLLSLLQGGGH